MTFNPEIPQAFQIIAQSQPQLLTNYQQLNLVYGDDQPLGDPDSDHFPFDDATQNARKHRKVRLPDTSSEPYTPLANEGVVYAKTDSDNETYPFWRRDTLSTDYPIVPIKAFGECTIATPPVLTANSFNIASVTRISVGQYRFDFSVAFPDADYVVQCSLSGGGALPIIVYDSAGKLTTSVLIDLIRQDGSGFTDAGNFISITILRN